MYSVVVCTGKVERSLVCCGDTGERSMVEVEFGRGACGAGTGTDGGRDRRVLDAPRSTQ